MQSTPDNPKIKEAWGNSEEYCRNVIDRRELGIFVNNLQPGGGKTYNLAEVISKTNRHIAFYTANHDHLDEFKKDLEKFRIYDGEYIHGKGFARSCARYPPKNKNRAKWTDDEKLVHKIYKGFGVKSSRFLCNDCDYEEECEYYKYTHYAKNYRITLQPLEFLYTEYNEDKDIFVVDEVINKKEILNWDFNLKKLDQFIFTIESISKEAEDYRLKYYRNALLKFHRIIFQKNSLIFTEMPSTLFNLNKRTFKDREDFLQNENYITHPSKINIMDSFEDIQIGKEDPTTIVAFLYRLMKELYGIIRYTDKQIRNVIKEGDIVTTNSLIENYIPLWHCLQIFEILFCKYDTDVHFLVTEKIEIAQYKTLQHKEKIETKNGYEYGFSAEHPYIYNKKTKECRISTIGKGYENTQKPLEARPKAWFTIGRPYLFQVFDQAEEKAVLLLDATFNDVVFSKLHQDWIKYYRIKKGIIEGQDQPKIHAKVDRIKKSTITNKNSIVYDVGNHFPLATMEKKLPRITGCIANIIEKNPDKTYAIISSERYEQKLQRMFKKSGIAHHFNERGRNINVDILFVVGTPFRPPYTIVYDYILTFNEYPRSTEVVRDGKKFVGYKDKLLNEILKVNVFDESYHEVHRNRLLLYNRVDYTFCESIKRLNDEITVKRIEHLDEISGYPLFRIMEKIIENDGMSYTLFYYRTRNQPVYDRVGGAKALLDEHEKEERIIIDTEKAKTKDKLIISATDKGKDWYKKQKISFAKSRWI